VAGREMENENGKKKVLKLKQESENKNGEIGEFHLFQKSSRRNKITSDARRRRGSFWDNKVRSRGGKAKRPASPIHTNNNKYDSTYARSLFHWIYSKSSTSETR
jgi:hypothetical protein